jgi:hypothetical protein
MSYFQIGLDAGLFSIVAKISNLKRKTRRYPFKGGGAFDRSCLNLPLAEHKRREGEGRGAQVGGEPPHAPRSISDRRSELPSGYIVSAESLSNSGGRTSSARCLLNCSTVPKCLRQKVQPVMTTFSFSCMKVDRLCFWISVWSARSSSDFFIPRRTP